MKVLRLSFVNCSLFIVHFPLFIVFFLSTLNSNAQELNCQVDVVSLSVQDASAQLIFKNMKDAIYQFMNTTKWTNDDFALNEKIECSLYINVSSGSGGDWTTTMTVQSRRPVYKSNYKSVIMNYQDPNVHLLYQLNQPLIFNINTYTDNITSILAFYAYMIIGNDYDTYSLDGGTKYYLDAQTIVTNAQNSGETGWKSQDNGGQNRFWMVSNILDENYYAPLRKAMYIYHRHGLDTMYADFAAGRTQVYNSLLLVQNVFNSQPGNFNVLLFFDAKATEIADIFSEAPNNEKANVMTILNTIDIQDINKYDKLKTE